MFTKIYWIENFSNGAALGIMPRPRGNDWLVDEIKKLKGDGIQTIVSLLEKDEIQELGLKGEGRICQEQQIDYINLPIKDRQLPRDAIEVSRLIKVLEQKINDGQKVVIHCRMGIGRASLIAGALLIQKGYKTDQIIEKISKARELKVPDTDEQVLWLRRQEK